MAGEVTQQLIDELTESFSQKPIQKKLKTLVVAPVIRQLVDQFFPYFVIICSLFLTIIVLLGIVMYNTMGTAAYSLKAI